MKNKDKLKETCILLYLKITWLFIYLKKNLLTVFVP